MQYEMWAVLNYIQLKTPFLQSIYTRLQCTMHGDDARCLVLRSSIETNKRQTDDDSKLSDRSEKSKRRTKTVNNTNKPTWNQSFVYSPIRSSELDSRKLEVTVWDFDRFGANDFLGEVVIELQHSVITEV